MIHIEAGQETSYPSKNIWHSSWDRGKFPLVIEVYGNNQELDNQINIDGKSFRNPKFSRAIRSSPKEERKRNGCAEIETRSQPQGTAGGKRRHLSSIASIGGQHRSNSIKGNRVGTFLV